MFERGFCALGLSAVDLDPSSAGTRPSLKQCLTSMRKYAQSGLPQGPRFLSEGSS